MGQYNLLISRYWSGRIEHTGVALLRTGEWHGGGIIIRHSKEVAVPLGTERNCFVREDSSHAGLRLWPSPFSLRSPGYGGKIKRRKGVKCDSCGKRRVGCPCLRQ